MGEEGRMESISKTPEEVAKWMLEQLETETYIHQETIVYEIAEKFGKQFTYDNANGNLAIQRAVLTAFMKLSKDSVVWERENRRWRKREPGDDPGRQQN
jgi:hypothetical protein